MSERERDSGDAADDTPAASYRAVDAATAVIIFVIGAIVAWDSYRIGAKWGSDGPEAGYFPFYIGLILCISSVINFINAMREKSVAQGGESFVSKSSLRMVFSVTIPTIIYVAAIGGIGPVPGLGIYVSSVIFIAVFMLWLGKYGWGKTIAVSIGVPVFFFLMFEIWFKVPLPKGPLEAMLGLD